MATTTRQVLEQRLSESVGDYESLTSSASGSATLTDADLAFFTEDTDGIQGWVEITSGDADGDIRRIASSGYNASTKVLTVTSNFSVTPTSASSYLWHQISPVLKRNAIQRAIELLFPSLYLPIRDETLIVDNLLLNPSFETGTFTSWTDKGSPSKSASTTRFVHGSQSAGIAATGAVEGLEQDLFLTVNIDQIVGKTLRVRGWVWDDASDSSRLRVSFDGSSFTSGPYHSGDAEWEGPSVHYIDAGIPADATEIMISCEVASGETGYFDLVVAWIDPIHRYTLPTTLVGDPAFISQQVDASAPDGPYRPIGHGNPPKPGRILRIEGRDYLSRPASDTATVEVDGARVDLIVARALEWLYQALSRQSRGEERQAYREMMREAQGERLELEQRAGIRMTPMSADILRESYTEEDASGRYLVLSTWR